MSKTREIVDHPEDYCHRCLGPNLSWYIDPSIWNPVMRPDGPDAPWQWSEIICPACFSDLFEEKFGPATFELRLLPESRAARAFAAQATTPEPALAEAASGLGWWAIAGDELLAVLKRAQAGEDLDILYAELYANSDTVDIEADGDHAD